MALANGSNLGKLPDGVWQLEHTGSCTSGRKPASYEAQSAAFAVGAVGAGVAPAGAAGGPLEAGDMGSIAMPSLLAGVLGAGVVSAVLDAAPEEPGAVGCALVAPLAAGAGVPALEAEL